MQVQEVVEELRDAVKNADNLPLTKKVLVDSEYILALIADLEENLPSELQKAKEIINEREKILNNAEKRAEKEIEKMISETAVAKEAEQQAKEVVSDAKEVAHEIRNGVNEYADEVLAEVEDDLETKLNEVRKNRAQLRPREKLQQKGERRSG